MCVGAVADVRVVVKETQVRTGTHRHALLVVFIKWKQRERRKPTNAGMALRRAHWTPREVEARSPAVSVTYC